MKKIGLLLPLFMLLLGAGCASGSSDTSDVESQNKAETSVTIIPAK